MQTGGKLKIDLKGRSLLRLSDLSDAEIVYLIDLADRLKKSKKQGRSRDHLWRKNIAMIFEKPSTRTRSACTVAAVDEGASVEYMDSHDLHLGKKESIKDSARVLGGMFDGIMFRGFKQETVETLARYAGVPVWNGLTDESHPTQTLADLMTIREYFHRLRGLKVVYVGDGRNNVCLSLMTGCLKSGIDFVDCTPRQLMPPANILARSQALASEHGCSLGVSHRPAEAVRGANVIYTDTWISMGEEKKLAERIRLLDPFRVTMELMRRTGNLDRKRAIFLHCLPALHNSGTEVTRKTGALEVTDEVFEAPFSKVFEQAENRLHTIKAIMVATLAKGKIKA
ncbi:MAG: ornithine carbamoyltransferase [Kiritimatiellia bacterium]